MLSVLYYVCTTHVYETEKNNLKYFVGCIIISSTRVSSHIGYANDIIFLSKSCSDISARVYHAMSQKSKIYYCQLNQKTSATQSVETEHVFISHSYLENVSNTELAIFYHYRLGVV